MEIKDPKIIITLEEGNISEVYTNFPCSKVCILDYDIEGMELSTTRLDINGERYFNSGIFKAEEMSSTFENDIFNNGEGV